MSLAKHSIILQCQLCKKEPVNCQLDGQNCNHAMFCDSCVYDLAEPICPICREPFYSVIPMKDHLFSMDIHETGLEPAMSLKETLLSQTLQVVFLSTVHSKLTPLFKEILKENPLQMQGNQVTGPLYHQFSANASVGNVKAKFTDISFSQSDITQQLSPRLQEHLEFLSPDLLVLVVSAFEEDIAKCFTHVSKCLQVAGLPKPVWLLVDDLDLLAKDQPSLQRNFKIWNHVLQSAYDPTSPILDTCSGYYNLVGNPSEDIDLSLLANRLVRLARQKRESTSESNAMVGVGLI